MTIIYTIIGFIVVWYFLVKHGLEILRCLYWTIWETIPEYRATKEVLWWHFIRHLWFRFWDHYADPWYYNSRSTRLWIHGYYPWEDREWF